MAKPILWTYLICCIIALHDHVSAETSSATISTFDSELDTFGSVSTTEFQTSSSSQTSTEVPFTSISPELSSVEAISTTGFTQAETEAKSTTETVSLDAPEINITATELTTPEDKSPGIPTETSISITATNTEITPTSEISFVSDPASAETTSSATISIFSTSTGVTLEDGSGAFDTSTFYSRTTNSELDTSGSVSTTDSEISSSSQTITKVPFTSISPELSSVEAISTTGFTQAETEAKSTTDTVSLDAPEINITATELTTPEDKSPGIPTETSISITATNTEITPTSEISFVSDPASAETTSSATISIFSTSTDVTLEGGSGAFDTSTFYSRTTNSELDTSGSVSTTDSEISSSSQTITKVPFTSISPELSSVEAISTTGFTQAETEAKSTTDTVSLDAPEKNTTVTELTTPEDKSPGISTETSISITATNTEIMPTSEMYFVSDHASAETTSSSAISTFATSTDVTLEGGSEAFDTSTFHSRTTTYSELDTSGSVSTTDSETSSSSQKHTEVPFTSISPELSSIEAISTTGLTQTATEAKSTTETVSLDSPGINTTVTELTTPEDKSPGIPTETSISITDTITEIASTSEISSTAKEVTSEFETSTEPETSIHTTIIPVYTTEINTAPVNNSSDFWTVTEKAVASTTGVDITSDLITAEETSTQYINTSAGTTDSEMPGTIKMTTSKFVNFSVPQMTSIDSPTTIISTYSTEETTILISSSMPNDVTPELTTPEDSTSELDITTDHQASSSTTIIAMYPTETTTTPVTSSDLLSTKPFELSMATDTSSSMTVTKNITPELTTTDERTSTNELTTAFPSTSEISSATKQSTSEFDTSTEPQTSSSTTIVSKYTTTATSIPVTSSDLLSTSPSELSAVTETTSAITDNVYITSDFTTAKETSTHHIITSVGNTNFETIEITSEFSTSSKPQTTSIDSPTTVNSTQIAKDTSKLFTSPGVSSIEHSELSTVTDTSAGTAKEDVTSDLTTAKERSTHHIITTESEIFSTNEATTSGFVISSAPQTTNIVNPTTIISTQIVDDTSTLFSNPDVSNTKHSELSTVTETTSASRVNVDVTSDFTTTMETSTHHFITSAGTADSETIEITTSEFATSSKPQTTSIDSPTRVISTQMVEDTSTLFTSPNVSSANPFDLSTAMETTPASTSVDVTPDFTIAEETSTHHFIISASTTAVSPSTFISTQIAEDTSTLLTSPYVSIAKSSELSIVTETMTITSELTTSKERSSTNELTTEFKTTMEISSTAKENTFEFVTSTAPQTSSFTTSTPTYTTERTTTPVTNSDPLSTTPSELSTVTETTMASTANVDVSSHFSTAEKSTSTTNSEIFSTNEAITSEFVTSKNDSVTTQLPSSGTTIAIHSTEASIVPATNPEVIVTTLKTIDNISSFTSIFTTATTFLTTESTTFPDSSTSKQTSATPTDTSSTTSPTTIILTQTKVATTTPTTSTTETFTTRSTSTIVNSTVPELTTIVPSVGILNTTLTTFTTPLGPVTTIGTAYTNLTSTFKPMTFTAAWNSTTMTTTTLPIAICNLPCDNGYCYIKPGTTQSACNCSAGFIPDPIQSERMCVDIDECEQNKCSQLCSNTIGGYTCSCQDGFSVNPNNTNDCIQIDYCRDSPCAHGQCVNTLHGYKCLCNSGWEGSVCDKDINECVRNNPCSLQSTCSNTNGSYQCLCKPGWTGPVCSLDIDECLSSPCGSRGTCSNTAGSFACSCQAGFTGQTCNVDINECLSNPCRNGATCNDLINSFSCQCAAGFSGRFCETNINECLSSPCKNGGICIDLINGFRCSCPSNWQGTTCETDVNECTNGQSRCSSNANCTNTPGSYICNCKAGYYGDGFTCKEDRLLKYTDGTKVTQRYKDFASPSINIPTEFPFGGAFYNTLYFTDNGVIIFRRNFYDPTYTMSYPYFFSNNDYYTPPMIAVFWADADFSRMGELWYKTYDFQSNPYKYTDVKATFESYVKMYFPSFSSNFQARWAIMITWENVLPYPAYYFSPTETNTYQAVLITDGIYSFCFMTFQDGGMNWRYNSLPTYYSPKMGYFSGETSSYSPSPNFPSFNDQQTSSANIQRVYTPDQYKGTNTNRMGYWAYRLEYNNAMTLNAKQQCLTWYYNDLYAYPSWIYYSRPCPCSYWQAVFDSSYTQASNLRSIQQKNTDLFSPYYTFQSAFSSWYGGGTRCYYNYMGGLSYGEKERFLPTPWEYENSWYRLQYPSFYYFYYYPYYLSQLERISKEYKELEVDPYNNCCRYSGSSYYCSLYRQRRPYDYCFGYVPPRIGVLYGDPHITTLDGVQYTFNGLGEFTLANVRDENGTVIFMLQGRTNRAGNGTQATNFIGLAALIQNQTTVEWSLRDSNTTLVKINGTEFSLPDNATYVDKVTLEKTEKNEVLASFDGGISVTVSAKLGALSFVTMLDTSYKNKTEGLLGMFNDDKTDDLIAANGTKLQFDGTKLPNESLIFEIGMTWKTTPSNTIFIYNEKEGESWYTYNNNSFVPLFYDELLQTSDPDLIKKANQTCGGNDECIFDILSTGNLAVGEATLGSVKAAQEQSSTMNNFPPNVTGPTTLMTKLYQPVTVSYTATDENNDTVILSLLSDSSDINLTADGVLVWLPTSSAPINATITADDSKVITEVALTLVLCNCTNNGSCLYDSPVSLINGTNNFMVAQCNCSAAWTGLYCEEDFNACAENKCYNTSTCVDRQAEEGFTCGPCPNNLEGDGITCRDIDECYSNTSNCQQICSNYMGGYNCSCIEGYTINSVNIYQCDDIDECHNGAYPCAENANCTNLPGNYSCACLPGYEGDPNWLCIDIDECALNQTNCPSESICNNMNGSYECQCLKGYEGVNCTDINECENSTCPQNSICQNTIGSFDCQCKEGFGGENCTDIDECSLGTSNCNSWAVCNNTVGSYECKCRDGYSGNGTYCVDIDECLSNSFVCGAHANCSNTNGSYVCSCMVGFSFNENSTCVDIDECSSAEYCKGAGRMCHNTEGSYECLCQSGYTMKNETCEDINECETQNNCSAHAICSNVAGSYKCECMANYTGDGVNCTAIDECSLNTTQCDHICTSFLGGHICSCRDGYKVNDAISYKCDDINECLNTTSPCTGNANCTNLPGNFSCHCMPGYEGDGYKQCTALTSTSETPTTPYDNKTTSSLATMEAISTPSVNESTFPTPFPLINASSVTPGDLNATTVSQMPKSTTESTNTTIQDTMTSNLTSSTNITTESPVTTVSATRTSVTSNATNTTAVTISNESTTLVTDTSPVSEMNTTVIASGVNETTERTTHSTTLPVTNTTYAISSENATVNLSSTESTSFTTPISETKTSVVTFGNTTTVSTNSSATLVSSGENATIVTTTSAPLPATDISAVTSTVNATTQSTINATVPVTSNTTGTSSLNATTQSTINATVPVTSTTSVPSSINATILSTINTTAIPVTSNTTGTSSLNATTQSSTNILSETSTTSATSNVNATTQSSMNATLSATSTSTNSVNTTILSPVNTTALPVTSNTTLTSSVNITILSTINTALPVATKTTVSSSANATTENQVSTTSATQTRNTTTVPATPTTIFISAMNTTAASNSTTAMPSTQSIVTALNASATFTTYVPTSGTAIKAVALFDYGGNAGDTAYTPRNTDFTSPVFSPLTGFPFGNQIRSFVYYTDNGQIVFPSSRNNRISYTNPPANGFSADYTVPSIAVFWNDADFSQNVGTTYYKEYTTNNDPVVKDVESMIRSNMNPSYSAAWTLKITWENAPAYPAKQNDNQTNTYQAVLTTDGFVSYVLMLYKDGGMNWDTAERYPKPLIGYCSGNRDAFFISDSKALNVYRPSNYVGANSALRGLWIYQLTSTSLDNSRMQCLNWYNNEPAPSSWNSNLLTCPCLYNQGTSDSRYRVTKAGQTSTVRLLRSTFPNTQNAGVRCLYYRKNQFLEGNQERTWISPSSKVDSELNAYDLCCNKVDDPQFCALYMEKRPPISCRNYRPLSPGWMFGDPHITTLDGFGYTFNGLGDFTLLNASDSNINFILQGRTEQTGVAMATNFKAFALQYISNGTSTKVELYLESNNTINVLLNGQNVSFTYSEDSEAQISDNPTVFLLKNETITATFEGVLSVSVSAYYGMLSAVSSLPSQFINKTKGLLGTWNNDQNDDFLAPNGTYISSNSSEETLYNYGLLWEAKENSLFSQQEVKARAAFQPLFLDSLIKQDQSRYIALQTQCSNKTECIFDAMSTNDTNVGLATFQVVSDFQKTNSTLNAMPPVIEGVKLIQAFMSNSVTVQFSSNKTGVTFTADPGTNSDITVMGNGSLTWKPTNLSGFTFRLVATDSQNLSSTFQPSFVVCNCMLESQCSYNLTTSISNSSLAIAACVCTNNYTGEFCQDPPNLCSQGCFPAVSCNNITGCGPCPSGFVGDGLHCTDVDECSTNKPCSSNALCTNFPGGYNCTCMPGYVGNGTYCEDDNECKNPSSCSLNAMCNNTIGSYQCSCNTGFTGNGTYCEDVDECKTSSPCSANATCTNTIGSYQCKCITGYTGNGTHCEDLDECKLSYCSPNAMCTNTVGSYQCKCNTGFTGNGTSCCSDCDPNYCPNGGTCIMSLSSCTPTCLCPPQYSDGRCTILGTNYEPLIKPNTKERTVYVILSSAETITQDLGYNKIKGILSSATVNVASLFNNATSSIERINNTSTSNFTARFTYRANFTVIDYLNDQLVYFINKSPKSRTKRAAGITIEQATEGDKLTRAELANAFTCVPGYNFNSVSLQCISKCDSYCLNDGICNLVGDNAICKCQPFSIYATSGDRCENLTMNLNAFFGILFGALAFLLLVFVGIVLGVYFYRKRKRNIYDDTDRMYETRFSWKSSQFPSFEKFKSEKEIPQLTVDKKIPNLVSWRPHLEKVDSLTEVKIKRPEFKAEMNEYEQNLE